MPKVVDADLRREELAAAAGRVIARAGIGAVTMREVAAEAGLTTGSLTHYIADKRELLLLTLHASLEQRRARRSPDRPGDPLGTLFDLLAGVLPTDDDRRLHWLVTFAFAAEAAGDESLAAEQQRSYRAFRSFVTRLVREAQAAGKVAGDHDAEAEAVRLITAADGISVQALFDPASWSPTRQRAALQDAFDLVGAR